MTDPSIQNFNQYDLEFFELSMIADNPEELKKLEESYYDPEFDEWLQEFEQETTKEVEVDDWEVVE